MQILAMKDDLSIITFTYGTWQTPGEFTNPIFACIEIEATEEVQPVKVEALGEPEPYEVDGQSGLIYRNATVDFEPVSEGT